ncbi:MULTISPECIES: precorrin-8X methylmutase [Pseudomonas]|uniref:Precorrin-8X methylmutase n=1 Tax=Pseudomonas lutea TaxID=243924 RepID=A0A9X8MCQ3_9PSED|nr:MULTISPECIES: precorrin-8X methylmutase [Pseudomonas]SEQ52772.1 precorrin-8X methylmutase [Pseudomonas lutea]
MPFDYQRDPEAIERQSFEQIRTLTDLSRFDPDQAQIAMRLVHTCGEPEIVEALHFSRHAMEAGLAAVEAQASILCDVEMVRHGLTRRLFGERPLCFLNDERIPALAKATGETRSMAALSLWEPYLPGSIVVIGNAPTALFRLLEHLETGGPRPALVIGMPVGFIGAAESKDALMAHGQALGVEWIALSGRRGGSALAAATLNALARVQQGIRW